MKAIQVRDATGGLFYLVIGPGIFFRENTGSAGKTAICIGLHWFYSDHSPDEFAKIINDQ